MCDRTSVNTTSCLQDSADSLTFVTNISDFSDEEFSPSLCSMYIDSTQMKNRRENTSDNSDNQCVPDCDGQHDGLGSRNQYYSDFVMDHHHLSLQCDTEKSFDDLEDSMIPFPRIVEGSEDLQEYGKSSNCSSSFVSSTLSSSDLSQKSRNRKQKNGSFPCASSTMICDISMDETHKHSKQEIKNNSAPNLTSKTEEFTLNRQNGTKVLSKSDGHHSACEGDLNSILMWSIHDDGKNKGSIEELYIQKFYRNHVIGKPPLPPRKNCTQKIAKLKEPSYIDVESLSGIEQLESYHDSTTYDDESMFDDVHQKDKNNKSRYLPRTSTRIEFDAKDTSDFHRVPESRGNSKHKSEKLYLNDKKAVIKKLKKFSKSLRNLESHSTIQTLANL